MRRRCDRSYGLGPIFFFDGEGGGAPGGGDAGGGGGGAPAQNPPAPPATTPPAGGQGGQEREGFIPRERFDEVNRELQARKAADEERERKELEAKGEHQKLAEAEKAKREAAEAKALTIARRASFIGAAAGKVADPEAAYKLAVADGLLNDLDVDDDGNAKDPKKPGAVVDEVVKRYEFLKAKNGDRSFGGDRGGNGQDALPVDPSKLNARQMLSVGYEQSRGGRRGT